MNSPSFTVSAMKDFDDLSNHFQRKTQRMKEVEDAAALAEAERKTALRLVMATAKKAVEELIEPMLLKVAEIVKSSGHHAAVKHHVPISDPETMREVCAASISLEAGDGRTHELQFYARASDTAWKVETAASSTDQALRDLLEGKVLPGTDVDRLADWSRAIALQFIKAVYPI